MAQVQIINPISRDFAMVPNALWRSDLPFAAKGVAAYLFSLRDGAFPYVAEMETALGLGRDARRKAFKALEAAGVIRWQVERDAAKRICAKRLILDPAALCRAPESQAHGAEAVPATRAPEKPAGGKSTPAAVETRRCGDGRSGDTIRHKKQERAQDARSAAGRALPPQGAARPAALPKPKPGRSAVQPKEGQAEARREGPELAQAVAGLSAWEKSRVRAGGDLLLPGLGLVKAGTPAGEALRAALRTAEGCAR